MSIGERRHRVTFQRASVSKDDFGEPDQLWSDLCTSWALVQALKGSERFSANQAQAEVDYRIVTRNRRALDNIGPDDRAKWNGRIFDIRAVIPRDHRQSELEILAQEHL